MAEVSGDWRDRFTWYPYDTLVAKIVRRTGKLISNSWARVECVGFENLPETPYIFASNHINILDVPYWGFNLAPLPHYMTKMELFDVPILGWVMRRGGSFPVDRSKLDRWALRQAGEVLAHREMLFIFPEGSRSGPKAELRRGKAGAILLALEHKVPIVPGAIFGTQNLRLTRPRMSTVRMEVGEPLDVVALAGPPPHSTKLLRELSDTLMRRIAAMLPPAHRGWYS